MDYIITTEQLPKKYKNFTSVNHVSLHIRKGSNYGFLGPNGAGKSTTMKMLLGLTAPTKGSFTIDGKQFPQDRIAILKEIGSFIEAPSFYANLTTFAHYYEEKWFPYTMPISDIYGLRAAIDNIADDPGILTRHAKIAAASRKAITGAGLKLYLNSGYSNTVTVFEVPECTTAAAILDGVKKDYNIMLAGSFDVLAGKVIRIGHMGNNATFYNVRDVFHALDGILRKLGVPLTGSMEEIFCENMK